MFNIWALNTSCVPVVIIALYLWFHWSKRLDDGPNISSGNHFIMNFNFKKTLILTYFYYFFCENDFFLRTLPRVMPFSKFESRKLWSLFQIEYIYSYYICTMFFRIWISPSIIFIIFWDSLMFYQITGLYILATTSWNN